MTDAIDQRGPDRPAIGELAALLGVIDAAASFTLCEIAADVCLAGSPFDSVSAFLAISGVMHMRLPDGSSRVARAGEMLLLPANTPPLISARARKPRLPVKGTDCLIRRDGCVVADATRGERAALVVAAARVDGTTSQTVTVPRVIAVTDDPAGAQAFKLMRAELAEPGPATGALAVSLMRSCIVAGLRRATIGHAAAPSVAEVQRRAAIGRAVDAVVAHPGRAHSLASLAELAGMSRATFARQFARIVGTRPMEFVTRTRLAEAATLLRTAGLSVKEVAAATAFASRSHFSRAFRASFGCDPTSYRGGDDSARPI